MFFVSFHFALVICFIVFGLSNITNSFSIYLPGEQKKKTSCDILLHFFCAIHAIKIHIPSGYSFFWFSQGNSFNFLCFAGLLLLLLLFFPRWLILHLSGCSSCISFQQCCVIIRRLVEVPVLRQYSDTVNKEPKQNELSVGKLCESVIIECTQVDCTFTKKKKKINNKKLIKSAEVCSFRITWLTSQLELFSSSAFVL